MKKFLTLIVVLMAAVCVKAETITLTPYAPNLYWGSKCVGWGTITFTSTNGEYKIAQNLNLSDYKGIKVVVDNASGCQAIAAGSVLVNDWNGVAPGEDGYNTCYETLYKQFDAETGEAYIEFSNLSSENTSVTKVEIQATAEDATAKIKSVTLIKSDDSEETLTEGVGTVWGCSYSTNNFKFTNQYGQVAFKTFPTYDATKIYTLHLTFDAAPDGLMVEVTAPAGNKYPSLTAGATSLDLTLDYEFSDVQIKAGSASAVNTVLSNVAATIDITDAPTYGDAQTIEYDEETHFIAAEQFDELSLDAMVEFTYNTEGADGYVGWGPMAISSKADQNADGAVTYSDGFGIKAEGENVVTCKLSDIADALNADYYPTTGKYGAYWCMWGFGDGACTNTRVSIKAYDCTNSTAEKFSANADGATTETITMSYDYATYIPQKALDFSEMTTIEAFVVTAVSDESVDLTKVYQVPAGTPIVVKGSTTDVPLAEYASEPETNLLTAATGTHIAVTGDYVLSVQDGVYGFYAAKAGTKITMGKAYLAAPSEAKVYTFNFGNDATAINAVKSIDAENGAAYNLAGQRVNANAKGIVVKNGRKFINK